MPVFMNQIFNPKDNNRLAQQKWKKNLQVRV